MIRRVATLLLVSLAVGCGPHASARLHPVTGQVLNRGEPVPGGSVRFARINDPTPLIVNAAVDESGRFELATLQDHTRLPGAPAGEYQVVYSPPVLGKDALPVTWTRTVKIMARANAVEIDLAAD